MEDALIRERFGVRVTTAIYKARYNCAPSQSLAVITSDRPDTLHFMRWGLIPSWAKERSIGSKMINARAETVAEKPSFRSAFKSRRCLVPATGFFEWKREGKSKIPYLIRMKEQNGFCFAGLWDCWNSPEGGEIESFTIITTTPNTLMSGIHVRMPVILQRESERQWLGTESGIHDLMPLLKPFPSELMEACVVSSRVNSTTHDDPSVLLPDEILF
jgi:putative SOS response-associated peptidase YedK